MLSGRRPSCSSYLLRLYYIFDLWDRVRGKRHELVPPRHLMFDGSLGDPDIFLSRGEEFLDYFKNLCGLQPHHAVLDVGSGIGRMAVALTRYLNSHGRYEGLEIIKRGVAWCTTEITSRYPNFRFTHADLRNDMYNPGGKYSPTDYVFPFPDDTFDFAVLTSVFTHMRPPEVSHYMSEISRVLKPGGRALITYFLLNPESERLVREGRSNPDVREQFDGFWAVSRTAPERAIALPESSVRALYDRHGLRIEEPVRYGSWAGRPSYLSYQDIVISTKRAES